LTRIVRRRCFWWSIVGILAMSLGIAGRVAPRYAVGMTSNLWSVELSIAYWHLILGLPTVFAILIAIVWGNTELGFWFYLADELNRFERWLVDRFRNNDTAANGVWSARVRKAPYVLLFFNGAIPGQVLIGVAVSKIFKLNPRYAYLAMAIGNTVKMIYVGLCLHGIGGLIRWLLN